MSPGFDSKSHRFSDKASTLAGFADANSVPMSFFEDFVVANGRGNCLRAIDASLAGVPDAARWRRLLVFDECIVAAGSVKAVVDAWRYFARDTAVRP